MKLIDFPEAMLDIAANQAEYETMPAHITDDAIVTCCWHLSMVERICLAFTGKIWHRILTFGNALQPQFLTVETPKFYMSPADWVMRYKTIEKREQRK